MYPARRCSSLLHRDLAAVCSSSLGTHPKQSGPLKKSSLPSSRVHPPQTRSNSSPVLLGSLQGNVNLRFRRVFFPFLDSNVTLGDLECAFDARRFETESVLRFYVVQCERIEENLMSKCKECDLRSYHWVSLVL